MTQHKSSNTNLILVAFIILVFAGIAVAAVVSIHPAETPVPQVTQSAAP